jgi:ribosomal protein L40E
MPADVPADETEASEKGFDGNFCPFCGAEAAPDSHFCGSCGGKLD